MNLEHWPQIKNLVQSVAAENAATRSNILQQSCAKNFALRRGAEALLLSPQDATRKLPQEKPPLPDRGQRIEQVFQSVLERDAAERAAYLHEPFAVIWDLDGTLINSVDYHWQAWRSTMSTEGFALTFEDFVADFGKRNDEILRSRFRADLTDAEVARISFDKEQHYRHLVRSQGLELLPGARHWLVKIKAEGWVQALGTSAPQGNIDAVFEATDIAQYFDAVMSSEQVRQGKPAPDVFLAAAQKLNVPPSRCIIVEDAPAGIEAGRRALMKTVGVLTTHEALQADLVVRSLTDLPDNWHTQFFSAI
jgi:beta-phosphoglucomutase